MAQPHGCYGLSARRMVVLWTFREPALCRRVHRAFMRNALLDYTPIIPATACHQGSYVETYSRSILMTSLAATESRGPGRCGGHGSVRSPDRERLAATHAPGLGLPVSWRRMRCSA